METLKTYQKCRMNFRVTTKVRVDNTLALPKCFTTVDIKTSELVSHNH